MSLHTVVNTSNFQPQFGGRRIQNECSLLLLFNFLLVTQEGQFSFWSPFDNCSWSRTRVFATQKRWGATKTLVESGSLQTRHVLSRHKRAGRKGSVLCGQENAGQTLSSQLKGVTMCHLARTITEWQMSSGQWWNNDGQGEMCSSDEWSASNLTCVNDAEPNTLVGSHGLTTRAMARPTC